MWFYLLPAPLITIGLLYVVFASRQIDARVAYALGLVAALIAAILLFSPGLRRSAMKLWIGTRPDFPRPFRMWLYPLPALLSIGAFLYVLFMRKNFEKEIAYAIIILIVGLMIYLVRSRRRREWPFEDVAEAEVVTESSP